MPEYLPSTHDYPTPPKKPNIKNILIGLFFVGIIIITMILILKI